MFETTTQTHTLFGVLKNKTFKETRNFETIPGLVEPVVKAILGQRTPSSREPMLQRYIDRSDLKRHITKHP